MFRCKNCLNASTRPRIEFDSRGWCNACVWMEEKKTLDWSARQKQLKNLLDKHSGKGDFDCIVTVSGGKDGSYVAHQLKSKYGVRPLCLTIKPPLALNLGERNLKAFIDSGFEHLHLSVNSASMRVLDRLGFEMLGQGYYGWLIAIHTAVLRIASNFGIKLVFYSEDGEIEYGGSTSNKNVATYGIDYMKRVYIGDQYQEVLKASGLSDSDSYWFRFPNENIDSIQDIEVAHYSYFESWDPYRNYLVAKEFCGLEEQEIGATGTFTNFAQNDQVLASLHYYLMYLKFGFGRATQDAGIEIRRGAMTREQAINLVKIFDSQAPVDCFPKCAEYFGMDMDEFLKIIDKFANKDLFEKRAGTWEPLFEVC